MRARALRDHLRREPLLVGLVALMAIAYATLSLVRHSTFESSAYDLAIFDQAIWHYSRFEAPESTVREVSNLLGDHFSPIIALLAPLYWVWPDPGALLVAQALLIAASIVPVFLFAEPRVGRAPAYLLAASYALFGGIQTGVRFDFHELAFAPLLVALAILFIDRRRWVAYFVTIGLLLLVKEDLSFLVVAFGVYLAIRGEYIRGAITAAGGLAWFFLTTELLIPMFADSGEFVYWTYGQLGRDLPDALGNIVASPTLPFEVAFEPARKIRTLLYLFAPFLGLSLMSPLAILAVPLLAERMLSTNPSLWGIDAHYSLSIAPILAMGAAAGIMWLTGLRVVRPRAREAALAATAAMLAASVALTIARFPLEGLFKPSFYRSSDADEAAERALQVVPDGATVAATSTLLPHLAHRDDAYLLGKPDTPQAEYLVADLATDSNISYFPSRDLPELQRIVAREARGYSRVFSRDGVVVFERPAPDGASRDHRSPGSPGPGAVAYDFGLAGAP